MSKTDNEDTKNNVAGSIGAVPINSNQLNNLLNQASSLQDTLRPHIAFQNKVNIYCAILNNVFPVFYRYTFLTLSIIYLWKHVIFNNILEVLSKLLPNERMDWSTLLIICSTIVLSSFIRKKWK